MNNYASRQNELKDIYQSLVGDLNELEKYLLNSQELLMVRGKVSIPIVWSSASKGY